MDGPRLRSFRFGVDKIPWWFESKINDGSVEYIHESNRRYSGCRFYDVHGKERTVYYNGTIYIDMLYRSEPMHH